MSDDTTKLLNACVEYRAMVDKLEAENAALWEKLKEIVTESDDIVRFQIARNALADKGKQP